MHAFKCSRNLLIVPTATRVLVNSFFYFLNMYFIKVEPRESHI